jgi:hypothetical protein
VKKTVAIVAGLSGVMCLIGLAVHHFATATTMGLLLFGDQVSSNTLVRDLSNSDRDVVMSGLEILCQRKDRTGQTQARTMLSSSDDYIWFNAALYLGDINDQQAVPYLIKGLKHPASRSYPEVVRELRALTTQTFGEDQVQWIGWWEASHGKTFSFCYATLDKQSAEIHSGSMILINRVIDPITISYNGSPIAVVGLHLKSGADPIAAQRSLETATLGQFVEIERDGSGLTADGAVPALINWIPDTINSPDIANSLRSGLAPVPFSQKSSVDKYLLKSGYYQLDLDAVHDPALRSELQAAVPATQPSTAPG